MTVNLILYGGMGGGYGNLHNVQENDHWESESRDIALDYAVEAFRRDTYVYTQEQMNKVIQASLVNARKQYELGYDSGFEEGYAEGNQNCQHR